MNMKRGRQARHNERGAALVEFAVAATVFLTLIFAVLEFGRLLWVHNALTDVTRRGARYAVNHDKSDQSLADIKNVAVYGNVEGTGNPLVSGLTVDHVKVNHSGWGLGAGTVTIEIDSYDFNFVVPVIGTRLRLPAYQTTLTGENVGYVPNAI